MKEWGGRERKEEIGLLYLAHYRCATHCCLGRRFEVETGQLTILTALITRSSIRIEEIKSLRERETGRETEREGDRPSEQHTHDEIQSLPLCSLRIGRGGTVGDFCNL